MDIKGIISIAGRPGLFKVVSQGKINVIVESILDKKRFPAFANEKISAVEDISIFTYDDDVKLVDVFSKLLDKYDGLGGISHKSSEHDLRAEFVTILPNYDSDRVYLSDIRKVFQWYNLLISEGILKKVEPEESEPMEEENKESTSEGNVSDKKIEKKSKPAAVKKAGAPKTKQVKAAKPNVSKKAPVVKTGSSRGK
jgi:hypothetical protein